MQDDFQDQQNDRRERKKCFISLDERTILKIILPFHNADPGGEIELGDVARKKKKKNHNIFITSQARAVV